MPTYDYECGKCGHRFEEFQGISAKTLIVCPKCGKRSLQRLIGTGGGFLFKGSGFYATDYKKKPSGGDAPKACPAPKGDSCKGCSLNKEKAK